jgi:hypothetical protein
MSLWLSFFIEVLSMSKDIEDSRIFQRRITEFRKDAAGSGARTDRIKEVEEILG